MSTPSSVSPSWKFTPVIAITLGILLLVAGLALGVYDERGYRAQKAEEAAAEARILAATVTAALAFDDRTAAGEYVRALQANPDVLAAAVYDGSGELFAAYARDPSLAFPPLETEAPPLVLDADHLVRAAPVKQGSSVLGRVYIEAVVDPIAHRLERYGVIALLASMAALMVGALGIAHGALSRANQELAARADALSHANRELEGQIRERRKAEDALRQSQKMEAIGRLTGGVAHDFNNLLTVVAGNLDLIQHMAAAPAGIALDRLQKLVDAAQRGLSRGERLTRQLLAFSRQQPLQSRLVDLNATINDFAPFIQRAVGETIALKLHLAPGAWMCQLDPAQFEAAILNLALNARDAMEAGGILSIETVPAPGEGSASPQNGNAQVIDAIVVTVADTGTGMAPEVQERIFEPFFTTKDVGKGSGLGLAQVWGFVNQSGGRITVDSQLGRGTRFSLFLPVRRVPEAAPAGVETSHAVAHGSETILVVEDDDDVRSVTANTLAELGYQTVLARDGHEALDLLLQPGKIDLLFSDYVMPNGLNGAELAREAQRRDPTLKVLLTSGYAKHAERGTDGAHVDGFPLIAKPYRVEELATRIRDIIEHGDAVPGQETGTD